MPKQSRKNQDAAELFAGTIQTTTGSVIEIDVPLKSVRSYFGSHNSSFLPGEYEFLVDKGGISIKEVYSTNSRKWQDIVAAGEEVLSTPGGRSTKRRFLRPIVGETRDTMKETEGLMW